MVHVKIKWANDVDARAPGYGNRFVNRTGSSFSGTCLGPDLRRKSISSRSPAAGVAGVADAGEIMRGDVDFEISVNITNVWTS